MFETDECNLFLESELDQPMYVNRFEGQIFVKLYRNLNQTYVKFLSTNY